MVSMFGDKLVKAGNYGALTENCTLPCSTLVLSYREVPPTEPVFRKGTGFLRCKWLLS